MQQLSNYYTGDEVALIPGALRVYRTWLASEGWLGSYNFDSIWGPGLNLANCLKSAPDHPMTQAPKRDCVCGFYATYRPEYLSLGTPGVIEVSGRVILGTRGVRAQKARIVALTGGNHRWTQGLRRNYSSIKWFDRVDDMLAAFPPQDVSELIGPQIEDEPLYDEVTVVIGGIPRTITLPRGIAFPKGFPKL